MQVVEEIVFGVLGALMWLFLIAAFTVGGIGYFWDIAGYKVEAEDAYSLALSALCFAAITLIIFTALGFVYSWIHGKTNARHGY